MKRLSLGKTATVATLLTTTATLMGVVGSAYAADLSMPSAPATAMYSPKPAANWVSGDLSFYGGLMGLSTNVAGDNTSGSLFGGVGRANLWIDPTWSAQFDLGAESDWESKYTDNYSAFDLAGHLSYRKEPGHLIGAFGSVGYYGGFGTRLATIGAEGQTYVGPFLLYGQVGYSTDFQKPTYGDGMNALYVHGEARYFVNPNLMLAANLGYARANETGGETEAHDLIRWGADLEWKHDTSPFGAFLSYQGYYDNEPSGGDHVTGNTVLAGIKIHFDHQTLKAESDSGATLKDFNPYTGVNQVRFFDWE